MAKTLLPAQDSNTNGKILKSDGTDANWSDELIPVSGSNAYGSWIKYPDGTLECWGKDNLIYNAPRMLSCAKLFPISFVGNVPSVNFEFVHGERTLASGTAWDGWITGIQTLTLESVEFRVWSVQTTNFESGDIMPAVWRAIGRWKA